MKLDPRRTLLIVCDMQQFFIERIYRVNAIINNSKFMIRTCQSLEMPLIVSTHYQKYFGDTCDVIKACIQESYKNEFDTFEKSSFSLLTNDCQQILDRQKMERELDTIIFTGIEAHICVQQSCLDLLDSGYKGSSFNSTQNIK